MQRHQLSDFAKWFNERQWRENSPFRELREELVEEAMLLPDLQPSDVKWDFLYTYENEQVTQREGVAGVLTHYFLEVFEVWAINPNVVQMLLDCKPESGAMLLDANTARRATTVQMNVDGAMRAVQLNASSLFQPES